MVREFRQAALSKVSQRSVLHAASADYRWLTPDEVVAFYGKWLRCGRSRVRRKLVVRNSSFGIFVGT
jgi:hypothetical protein